MRNLHTLQFPVRGAATRAVSRLVTGALLALVAVHGRADVAALLERVPAGPVAVVTWEGFNDADAAYADSRFKAMLDDTELVDRWSRVIGALMQHELQNDPDLAEARNAAERLGPAAWQRPWVAYFGGVEFPAGLGGQPRADTPAIIAGFLIDAGEDADAFRPLLERAVTEAQGDPDFEQTEVTLIDDAGVIGIRLGRMNADDAAPALAEDAHYTDTFADTGHTGHIAFYADLAALRTLIHDAIALEDGNPEDAAEFDRIVDGLGLGGLGRVAWSGGFVERDWQSVTWLETVGPREGLLTLLDQDPLPDDVLRLTTAAAPWARATRFDLAAAYDTIVDALRGVIDEHDVDEMDDGLASINDAAGFDVRHDLLANLGSTWLVYTDAAFGGLYGSGVAIVLDGLKDPDRVNELLLGLQEQLNAEMGPDFPFKFTEMDLGETVVQTMPLPVFSPSWTIKDGRWVFANSPQAVLTAVQAAADPEHSIVDSAAYADATPALAPPGGADAPRTGVMVLDPKRTAVTIYQTVNMMVAMMGGEIERETGVKVSELVPPLNTITPHLSAAGSVSWVGDDGWHCRTRSPFPLATMLSPDVMTNGWPTAVVFGLVGIRTNVAADQGAVNQARTMANMRQVLIALMVHAADHNEQLPATLDGLVAGGYLPDSEVLRQPRDLGEEGPRAFVFVQPNKNLDEVENLIEMVVLIEQADFDHDGFMAVGFADGHVRMLDRDTLDQKLAEQTGRSYEQWTRPALQLN